MKYFDLNIYVYFKEIGYDYIKGKLYYFFIIYYMKKF